MITASFWKDRRVLLTGHTGFKGSWLSLWLQRLGAEVTGLALAPPSVPSLFEDADVGKGMVDVRADVRRLSLVREVMALARPQVVIHMAAQSLVRRSYEAPVETFKTNVMGTVHILEAARETPCIEAVLVVTSDKCYDNREWIWGYREPDPMGGADPYSGSKGCAELVVDAYRRSFFEAAGTARVASARSGNVIGGGDWSTDRLIPDATRAWVSGRTVALRNPHAVRPWQHVLEPLSGYLLLVERLCCKDGWRFASGWNFGPREDDSWPVGRVIAALAERWGPSAKWMADDAPGPHEARMLHLDCTRARMELGWRPRLPLEEALGLVARWYRDQAAGASVRELTEGDIDRYEQEVLA